MTLDHTYPIEASGLRCSDETRQVSWNEIAACQFEERVETFSEGIAPTTSSAGTFAVEFFQVPLNTLNKDGWAIRVDSTINSCPM